jgi:hypothetical protein
MNASRQEWFKLRDDFLEDVFVCIEKKRPNNFIARGTFLSERYIKREIGLEVHYIVYGKKSPCYWVAIFEAPQRTRAEFFDEKPPGLRSHMASRNSPGNKRGDSMFIQVPHFSKDMKKARPITSIVKLFVRNPVLDFDWETLNLGRVGFSETGLGFMEFESKVAGGISRLCQPIDQVINGRTKVVNCISSAKAKRTMRFLLDPHNESNAAHIPFSLYLAGYDIWPVIKKRVGFRYEFIDAMPCPIEPSLGKLHIFRTRVTHETNQTDSGNIKRCGNPHSKAGRVLQESE